LIINAATIETCETGLSIVVENTNNLEHTLCLLGQVDWTFDLVMTICISQ